MTTDETLREIKQELRSNMNGVASARMRESGLCYHVNFGIELPRLQTIAAQFTPSHELAQRLWHEDVRESKILAAMLMPVERFYPEVADIWVSQIPNAEIAQMASAFLFSRLPYAPTKAFEWIAASESLTQLCGYLIVLRLLQAGAEFNERSLAELRDQISSVPATAPLPLRKVVTNLRLVLDA